jgi:lipopolysaccharide export system protein LptA
MSRSAVRLISALVALALPGLAAAQIAPAGHGPVDVTADQLEVEQGQCLANWSGNAEALQDTSRLRADSLKIYNRQIAGQGSNGQSCGQLDRMEADGQVYYVTPAQVVKADHAVYTAADTTIVMTGDVVAAQGSKGVIAGSRLVINTNTGVATMSTDVTGRGAKGRVRGVFDMNSAGGGGQSGLAAPVPPPPRRHPQS